MLGTVVREGTLYSEATDRSESVGRLERGQRARVLEKIGDGGWIKVQSDGQVAYTKSYRLMVNGARLDLRYGYTGWLNKPYGVEESREVLAEETRLNAAEAKVEACEEDEDCDACDEQTVTISTGVVQEAAILDAGQLGLSPVPGGEGRSYGFFEPGGGTLQFLDRLFTSRERKAALKAQSAGRSAPISKARYAFGASLCRCATVGGVAYCAMQVALAAIG
jgi:hypothetical protein